MSEAGSDTVHNSPRLLTQGNTSLLSTGASDGGDAHPLSNSFLSNDGSVAESEPEGRAPPPENLSDSFSRTFEEHAKRFSPQQPAQQPVNFQEIAKSPLLARAARAEMDSRQHSAHIDTGGANGGVQIGAHDAELERQQAAIEAVDKDADTETRINKELGQLLCVRLDASRKCAERLLGMLQALAGAEAGYARALALAAKVPLTGDCDGRSLRAALRLFSQLPHVVGERHRRVQDSLGEVTTGMQGVVGQLRRECGEVQRSCGRAHLAVEAARAALRRSLADHQAACQAADAAALERQRSGGSGGQHKAWAGLKGSPAEVDPWLTESGVVAARRVLQGAQALERRFLADAFLRVKALELRRIAAVKAAIQAFLSTYREGLLPESHSTEGLAELVGRIDGEQDLAELSSTAAAAAQTGEALALRQAEALEQVSQELLCSPEIVRQGEMALWHPSTGRWGDHHFVLTRSGFLHWLRDMENVSPVDGLHLGRCHFEAGEAPVFNITEEGAGAAWFHLRTRKFSFKPPSIEECCEWAIALREAISDARRYS